MKRLFALLILVCLLAAPLSGCAGELPPLPPLPGQEPEPSAPASAPAPEDVVVINETPAPAPVPAAEPTPLELGFTLPPASEEVFYYFSPEEEFGCGFAYPAHCTLWAENGSLRLGTSRFFARMFFTAVRRDAPSAPEELLGLLEPGKWNSAPTEITVGADHAALRMINLKYDTWRRWIVWETPDRFYQLYGVCFDGREEAVGAIFGVVTDSFRSAGELLKNAPAAGTALYDDGALRLRFAGAQLRSAQGGHFAELLLSVENSGRSGCELSVAAYTADAQTCPFEASFGVLAGEERLWTLSLPLTAEEGGALFESLGFWVNAQNGDGQTLFELPVRIEVER